MRKNVLALMVALCLVAGVAHAGESLQIGAMPLGRSSRGEAASGTPWW
jgi:hypothetical protein